MRKMQLIVPLRLRKMILTLTLAIASSVWMTNEASNWCMPAAQTSTEQPIRIGGTFQTDNFPCVDETEPCPPCLTIVLASGGHYYLVSDDPQIVATLDTVTIGSFAIIEGIHYLLEHHDYINVTHIFFPETDITQLTGEWEVYKETVSTPTGDAGTRWFSTHDVNNTNYIIENNSIYKVVLDQASGYAHYSDIVPYSIERKEDGTWLLTAEGLFSSANPVEEGVPTPLTIYKLTENEIEWMYAANGGDEGPNYYYQYLRRYINTQNDKLPSLCDQWNVLKFRSHMGYFPNEYYTQHYRLTSDTVMNGQLYTKLYQENSYSGAMREGNNRDIYYVPADSIHEYLLYAFNAQVGDTLTNVWFGMMSLEEPSIKKATILEIKPTSPKTFVIDVESLHHGTHETEHRERVWIEGVGLNAPDGGFFPPLAGGFSNILLCAYKNGEQVYVSDWGEQYGCEYNQTPLLPSLCDEWNVLEHFMDGGPEYESFKTLHYRLTSDTIFNGMHYVKFEQDNIYKGAMREGANADIYFVPANSTHEYLLYAFNAKTGDQLDNLWFGANEDKAFIIHSATVTDIESVTPRKFVIDFEWQYNTSEIIHSELIWLEGLGFQYGGPVGYTCPFDCVGSPGLSILCAYKNGEQVYVSEKGEQYGCEYNYNPFETPTDTIPLFSYTGDDPGSSTVDPVDPNQVVATLQGNQLTIHENSGEEINYTLRHNTSAQTPALRMAPKADSFREEVTISITESGEYTLQLTNPSWGYAIFGQFNYSPQGIDQIPVPAEENSDESHRKTRKILINGHILIIRGGKTFTLSGQITDGQTTVNRQSKPR